MEIVSRWIQQKSDGAGVFSSALFCLWLSVASLAVLLDRPATAPAGTETQVADGEPAEPPETEES